MWWRADSGDVVIVNQPGAHRAAEHARTAPQFNSHPSTALALQLFQPEVHDATVHVLAAQLGTPLATAHGLAHAPQFASDVRRSASQPFAAIPSQLPKLVLQVKPHVAPVHALLAFATAGHAAPHIPQLASDVRVSVSQPFAAIASQLPRPAAHDATVQIPAAHAAVANGSEHAVAHDPQLATEVRKSASQPLAVLPSQLPKPALQLAITQAPATHDGVAFASKHAALQAPQLATDVLRSVSHPFAVFPSQSPRPGMQVVGRQTPIRHAAPEPGNEHDVAHVPQCATSVSRFTSHPLAVSPSQSA